MFWTTGRVQTRVTPLWKVVDDIFQTSSGSLRACLPGFGETQLLNPSRGCVTLRVIRDTRCGRRAGDRTTRILNCHCYRRRSKWRPYEKYVDLLRRRHISIVLFGVVFIPCGLTVSYFLLFVLPFSPVFFPWRRHDSSRIGFDTAVDDGSIQGTDLVATYARP